MATDSVAVTAFHVVGSREAGQWCHEAFDVTYDAQCPQDERPICLEPVCFDADADLAVLRAERPVSNEHILPIASERTRIESVWRAEGFPSFSPLSPFVLSGTVTAIHRYPTGPKSLQLLVREATEVGWAGVSGAAVTVDGRVVGVVTSETDNTNTIWAADLSAVVRLMARALDRLARAHPEDSAVRGLQHELGALTSARSDGAREQWIAGVIRRLDEARPSHDSPLKRGSQPVDRLLRRLDMLLELSTLLTDAERQVLRGGAYASALRRERPGDELPSLATMDGDSFNAAVTQVVSSLEYGDIELAPDSPEAPIRTRLITALIEIGRLLVLDRTLLRSEDRPDGAAPEMLHPWLCWFTEEILPKRHGIVRYCLTAPSDAWRDPVRRAVALGFYAALTRVRQPLKAAGVALALDEPTWRDLVGGGPPPNAVRRLLARSADASARRIPRLEHLGEGGESSLSGLVPLCGSAVYGTVSFSIAPGYSHQLAIGPAGGATALLRESGRGHDVMVVDSDELPCGEAFHWRLSRADRAGLHETARGMFRTLDIPERARASRLMTDLPRGEKRLLQLSLNLLGDILVETWPRIESHDATVEEALQVHQMLLSSYEWLRATEADVFQIDNVRNAANRVGQYCVGREKDP